MRIGIDLGGTKIEGIVLDINGKEQMRQRIATPRGSYRQILDAIAALINQLENTVQTTCTVGIGTPGSLNRQGLLRNSNTTELNGKPLLQDLEQLCGRPLRISNDANCFALSEACDGAGSGFHTVFGVIIGTGTGGGVVINQQLLTGANHIGGEWGHNPLPWPQPAEQPGRACYCGQAGCIETFLSGPGLSAQLLAEYGRSITAAELASLAQAGDRWATAQLERYADRLARSLATVMNVLDPDCIVLGGGLSKIPELYQLVPRLWQRYVFSDEIRTQLLPPLHGDSSGVRGAAWLWP